jgi:copper chaperone CopZ
VILLSAATSLLSTGGCDGDGRASGSESAAAVETARARFNVEGMTCTGCETLISGNVLRIPGVTSCTASWTDASLEVGFSDPAASEMVIERVKGLGYAISQTEPPGTTADHPG